MKLNNKLYFILRVVELIVLVLICIGALAGFLFVLDSIYPFFKYTTLFSYIICISFITVALIRLGFIVRNFKLEKFQQASKTIKLRNSFAILLHSLLIITSIEYILYLKNIDNLMIDRDVLEYSIQDDIDNINDHIGVYEQYECQYNKILQNIYDSTFYFCHYEDEEYYIVIDNDTLQVKLHHRPNMAPPMHVRERGKEHDFYGVRECGISLKNESYNLSHPSSSDLKTDIISSDSICGKNIKVLIEQKVQYYKNQKERFFQILDEESHISFGDFLINCLLNQGVINSKTNVTIRLLLVIQAVIITFVSGYIYQLLYKILDGE